MIFGFLLMLTLPLNSDGLDAPDVDILALNEEMKQFLDEVVMEKSPYMRLQTLVYAIFSEDFLNLTYDNSRTKTAIETFKTRNGNCLSFTTMFVAMARYAGLDAHFQEVFILPTWTKKGDIVLLSRHMNAVVQLPGRQAEIDFNP